MENRNYLYSDFEKSFKQNLEITDNEIVDIFLENSKKASFFHKGFGKKMAKRVEALNQSKSDHDLVLACLEKQNDGYVESGCLSMVSGFFYANAGICPGVLILYKDKAMIYHVKFTVNFGLIGLALTGKHYIRKMDIDIKKLVAGNNISSRKGFDYIHYGRYAFYIKSPLEMIHCMTLAKKIVSNKEPETSKEELINIARSVII